MDWESFLSENSAPLIALLGVALGGAVAGAASFATQSLLRRWHVADQRAEWTRRRLQEHLEIILQWQDQWIRLVSHVRAVEGTTAEGKSFSRKAASQEIARVEEQLQEQRHILQELTAVTVPIVAAIGNDQLKSLDKQFRETASGYRDVLISRDVQAAISANIQVIAKISSINAETRRLAEQLLLETFDSNA